MDNLQVMNELPIVDAESLEIMINLLLITERIG